MSSARHPIAQVVLDSLEQGDDQTYLFVDGTWERLAEILGEIPDTEQLVEAVLELVNLAQFLRSEQSSQAADYLLHLVLENCQGELEALGVDPHEVVSGFSRNGTAKGLKDLLGQEQAMPRLGAKKPEGSIPAGPMARFTLGTDHGDDDR